MQGSPRLGEPGTAGCNPTRALLPGGRSARVWGWLEGAGQLPNVLLRGAGAALGCELNQLSCCAGTFASAGMLPATYRCHYVYVLLLNLN